VTDRDDELRRKLGWTGPEETDYEPSAAEPEPTTPPTRLGPPPTRQAPAHPPADYVPPSPSDIGDEDPGVTTEVGRVPIVPTAEPGSPRQFREADRTGGSFRQPPPRPLPSGHGPYGPPPGSPRDTGPLPSPDSAPWSQQPERQPPRQQRPPMPGGQVPPPPAQTQPWSPSGYGPDGQLAQPPSGSYAERIRADELVPPRRVPPGRGWRLALYKASFGLVNLGPGPDEIRQAQLESKVRSGLRGHFKVGVMGKGGVGKTTVSASIGSVFAELRQDDRVVAIDADTAFGKLGSRVDPRVQGSYWELAADQHLETFADVRSRVGNNAAGLFVLAGEGTPARRRVLDPAIYREATSRLDRYFTMSIIDCSSTMDTPVTQEVLRDLDALVVVSSPWVDGAAAAGQTLDWLAARGLTGLLQRTVIVLNDSDGHADTRTRSILAQQFSSQGQVVIEVPFDGHLRPGGVIDRTGEMSAATRRRFIEIAAALAEYYPTHDDRSRERY
jgi:MinD-like ATPase involved in chromosome partitioning or flagellar assembly